MNEGYEYPKKALAVDEKDIDCWKNIQGFTLTKWNSIGKRRHSYDKEKNVGIV